MIRSGTHSIPPDDGSHAFGGKDLASLPQLSPETPFPVGSTGLSPPEPGDTIRRVPGTPSASATLTGSGRDCTWISALAHLVFDRLIGGWLAQSEYVPNQMMQSEKCRVTAGASRCNMSSIPISAQMRTDGQSAWRLNLHPVPWFPCGNPKPLLQWWMK